MLSIPKAVKWENIKGEGEKKILNNHIYRKKEVF